MAGEIEEPFRLNFQADLLHSGSISFGRFESESLSWERRSIFSHNRYLEEVEKYSKPGTVTEKKAYFEAHFRRKALLKQNSSECQDGGESPTNRNNDLHDLEESGNGNEGGPYTYFGESLCSSGPSEYIKETEIDQHEKGDVEALYAENGNGSRHVACFFESPYNSGHDEDSIIQEFESQNYEFLSTATQDEPVINIVDFSVSVPEHVKLDEVHQSETEEVMVNSEESIDVTLNDEVVQVDVGSKANDSSLTCQTPEKDDDTSSRPRRMFSPKVKPASEKKLTMEKLNTKGIIDRFQKHDSNEASRGSMKPKTSESKGLLVKRTEKKSPRPASFLTCSGVTSKAEDAITSLKGKELRHKKSIVKDLRSEKAVTARSSLSDQSFPGVRPTVNRSSKAHITQSTAGFSFKTDQRAENRKEFYTKIAEKMQAKEVEINQVEAKTLEKQAAEMKQFRRSLNFKATPMPSFYNESAGVSDEHKVKPISTTTNQPRPRSHSMATRRDKNASKSCVPSDTRPSSSTSSTNRRSVKEQEKKNNTRLAKHKETEPRARHMVRKQTKDMHMGSSSKSGRLAVGVAS
ncbi:protein WVD2-like 7 [Cynara cardunculus var. scolymus]|uniref:protein WVD2-like 7 n=1 Tax=Cynara cardunculus var. scolymus TaxID=59895 RepID=UPI000D628152|nr:protein WVD2-like 7 [Cynara cardunculus var. scolymus]